MIQVIQWLCHVLFFWVQMLPSKEKRKCSALRLLLECHSKLNYITVIRELTLLLIHMNLVHFQKSFFVILDTSDRQWMIPTGNFFPFLTSSQFPDEPAVFFSLRVILMSAVLTMRQSLSNGQLELLRQAEPCRDPKLQAHTRARGLKHPLHWHNLAQSFARTSIVCL